MWECQNVVLGYNYHTARQSGTATVRYISYHPVAEPLSLVRDIIITANGIVYQWNKEPNKEILVQNTSVQHLNLLNLTTVNPLHSNTTSYQYNSLINVKNSLCRFSLQQSVPTVTMVKN